jgi:hypothetical protein
MRKLFAPVWMLIDEHVAKVHTSPQPPARDGANLVRKARRRAGS